MKIFAITMCIVAVCLMLLAVFQDILDDDQLLFIKRKETNQ